MTLRKSASPWVANRNTIYKCLQLITIFPTRTADVNAELFDVRAGERISLAIARLANFFIVFIPDDCSFHAIQVTVWCTPTFSTLIDILQSMISTSTAVQSGILLIQWLSNILQHTVFGRNAWWWKLSNEHGSKYSILFFGTSRRCNLNIFSGSSMRSLSGTFMILFCLQRIVYLGRSSVWSFRPCLKAVCWLYLQLHLIFRNSFLFPFLLQPSLLDSYDYAMHGRVFSIKHIENQNIEVQASFGGLLCRLRGEQSQLEALQCDMMWAEHTFKISSFLFSSLLLCRLCHCLYWQWANLI
jgi:hypothetical protein